MNNAHVYLIAGLTDSLRMRSRVLWCPSMKAVPRSLACLLLGRLERMKETSLSNRGIILDSLALRVPAFRSASIPGSSGVRLRICTSISSFKDGIDTSCLRFLLYRLLSSISWGNPIRIWASLQSQHFKIDDSSISRKSWSGRNYWVQFLALHSAYQARCCNMVLSKVELIGMHELTECTLQPWSLDRMVKQVRCMPETLFERERLDLVSVSKTLAWAKITSKLALASTPSCSTIIPLTDLYVYTNKHKGALNSRIYCIKRQVNFSLLQSWSSVSIRHYLEQDIWIYKPAMKRQAHCKSPSTLAKAKGRKMT